MHCPLIDANSVFTKTKTIYSVVNVGGMGFGYCGALGGLQVYYEPE